MRSEEFQDVCQAVKSGQEKFVKHIVTHKVGKVTSCHSEDHEFEVDCSGEHKTWIMENCKEDNK